MTTLSPETLARPASALPFWLSLGLIPVVLLSFSMGGLFVLLPPLYSWGMFTVLDALTGLNQDNASLDTEEDDLTLYRMITLIWFPIQFLLLCLMLWYVPQAGHLNLAEKLGICFGMGVATGTIGINYSHELMHQKSRLERWLADLLLATVLYSHFRSEHLRVHHLYVGTPRDAVTARYNENFHRFLPRVVLESGASAFRAERAMLARKGRPWFHPSNPFWRYWALQAGMVALALTLGGWEGLLLFAVRPSRRSGSSSW